MKEKYLTIFVAACIPFAIWLFVVFSMASQRVNEKTTKAKLKSGDVTSYKVLVDRNGHVLSTQEIK